MQKFKKLICAFILSMLVFSVIDISPVSAYDGIGDDFLDDLEESLYYDDYDYDDYVDDGNNGLNNQAPVSVSDSFDVFDSTRKNDATGYIARVYDMAGLMSQTECKSVLDKAYDITQFCDIYVLTTNVNSFGKSENSTFEYCDDFYLKTYNNVSGKDVVIFIIDMANRYVYIYRNGSAKKNLSKGKCESITDNIYSYASKKDYLNCSVNALDQIFKVLDGQRIAQPMKVVSNFLIAAVCGFVIMYLVALGKSKASKPSDSELLKYVAKNFGFANQRDVITGTTKTYCPRSSGSGGRSGGGGHSSGGGGGGHRF